VAVIITPGNLCPVPSAFKCLRDLPVRQPERLIELSATPRDGNVPFSYPMLQEVERGQHVLSDFIGWNAPNMFDVEVSGVLSQSNVIKVSMLEKRPN